jgi:hypothetical protein
VIRYSETLQQRKNVVEMDEEELYAPDNVLEKTSAARYQMGILGGCELI